MGIERLKDTEQTALSKCAMRLTKVGRGAEPLHKPVLASTFAELVQKERELCKYALRVRTRAKQIRLGLNVPS